MTGQLRGWSVRLRASTLDPIQEAFATLSQRPGRTLLTATASALGVGVLVLTIGLTDTLERRISDEFDALRATEVVLQPQLGGPNLYTDAEQRIRQINGVNNAGTSVRLGVAPVGRTTIDTREPSVTTEILAASPAALATLDIKLLDGRVFDTFHTTHAPHVAILGQGVARRLGIGHTNGTASITINGKPHTVLAIATEVVRRPAYTGMILVPLTDEPRLPTGSNLEELLIETAPGAASIIASQAAVAISPHAPEQLNVSAPPDASTFRQGIEATLRTSLLALGGAILIIGLLGIANSTFISVLERTKEIGIRRAIGARPVHISIQVLTESGITGGIGGLIGTSLAVVTLVGLSAANGWTPTLTATLLPLGPVIGTVTGCLAGIPPARRANRIQPTQALRL